MSKELATRALFADALAGRIDRRTLLRRAAALGAERAGSGSSRQ